MILTTLVSLLTIIMSDLLLSGDNAVVIAMAAHRLPETQRKKAIFWGAVGAIILRIALTFVAFTLLEIPLLQAAGGAVLLWVGAKLLVPEGGDGHKINAQESFGAAVRTILVADLVMSLDNVLAVAGASHGSAWMLVVGLGLSMPPILFGAHFLGNLMDKAPWLMYVGAGLLGMVAGKMLVEDPILSEYVWHNLGGWTHYGVPAIGVIFVLAVGTLMARNKAAKQAGKGQH